MKRKKRANIQKEVSELNSIWSELSNNEWRLSSHGENSITNFLKYLSPSDIYEAMIIASERIPENTEERQTERFKYFCGICWNIIKDEQPSVRRV